MPNPSDHTQPDPLFDGVDDEHLAAAAEGCNELTCLYHRRINLERRRRQHTAAPVQAEHPGGCNNRCEGDTHYLEGDDR